MGTVLTGEFLEVGVARAVGGVFLPIGLVLVLLALGVALRLRRASRKVRWAVGVLGAILVILGAWSLLSKPSLMITALKAYPLQQSLRSGEPCPESVDVLAVVRAKGGPERVPLSLSSFGGGKIIAVTPKFEQSEKDSRHAFGPYEVPLPKNPPRTGVPVLLRVSKPVETGNTTVIRNAGCVPRH